MVYFLNTQISYPCILAAFEDHFSRQARQYARYRPSYPNELFAYLASLCADHQLAWDCGTGSGQAALGLVDYFDSIVATDASSEQLDHAFPHAKIEYRVEPAENVSLDASSVDLVIVAIAVHWFNFDEFYREVQRVLKPEGILAVWTYYLPLVEPQIDHVIQYYYSDVLAGYWPERIHYIDERYQTLPFPFEELSPPVFEMSAEWNLWQITGFLDSWSATRNYERERGKHPLKMVWSDLIDAWGSLDHTRVIRWPLHLRVGKLMQ